MQTDEEFRTPPMRRKNRTWIEPRSCLGCDRKGTYGVKMRPAHPIIDGEEFVFESEKYHCSACGAEWMSPAQGDAIVIEGVSLFQKKYGMVTGAECEQRRKSIGWTQQDLVDASNVSIATIKRLESGVHILTRAHNDATERGLQNGEHLDSLKQAATIEWTARQMISTMIIYDTEPVACHAVEAQYLDEECSYGIVDNPELLCA